jgi:hypothetical protein
MESKRGALHLILFDTSPLRGHTHQTCSLLRLLAWMLEIAVCRLQVQTSRVHLQSGFEDHRGVNNMGKRITDYPHTISFRVTDEAWLSIQKQIAGSELTVHEWCRKAALERDSITTTVCQNPSASYWNISSARSTWSHKVFNY